MGMSDVALWFDEMKELLPENDWEKVDALCEFYDREMIALFKQKYKASEAIDYANRNFGMKLQKKEI